MTDASPVDAHERYDRLALPARRVWCARRPTRGVAQRQHRNIRHDETRVAARMHAPARAAGGPARLAGFARSPTTNKRSTSRSRSRRGSRPCSPSGNGSSGGGGLLAGSCSGISNRKPSYGDRLRARRRRRGFTARAVSPRAFGERSFPKRTDLGPTTAVACASRSTSSSRVPDAARSWACACSAARATWRPPFAVGTP